MYGVRPVTVSAWVARGHLVPSFRLGNNWGATDRDLAVFEARRRVMNGRGTGHPSTVRAKVGQNGAGKKLRKK